MMHYRVALFIGRFQPFHNGHLYSLKKCLELAERVVIAVGSSQESGTANNPWDYKTRKRMVCSVVRAEGVEARITKIISCPDFPSDEEWVKEIVRRVGRFDLVVSNNEWTLRVLGEAGYQTVESGLYNRDELEGVKIRALLRANNESWRLRVPEVVAREIDMNAVQESYTFTN